MNKPCKPELLSYLVSTKEFRVIPTPIWRQVQSNPALSVESRFLWTVLWELCSLQPNFEKPLTWGFLSKRVGKSESTIRRWARALQKLGYLEIRNVFAQEGGQLPSLFRIGVPLSVAEIAAKNFPDRRKKEEAPDLDQTDSDESNNGADTELDADEPQAPELAGASSANEPTTPDIQRDRGVTPDNPAHYAESTDNVLKNGGDNPLSRVKSKLADRIDAIGKGSNRSSEQRTKEKRSDVPDQSDRFSNELLEIRQRAAKMVPTKPFEKAGEGAQEGGVKVGSTLAVRFGTQENIEAKQENNRTAALRSLIRRALVIKLGLRQDLEKLVEEFAVSIEKGSFKKFDLVKAINIGVKLVREGRWKAPRFVA